MKQIYAGVAGSLFLMLMFGQVCAQPRYDVIYPVNGEAIRCNISESQGAQLKYRPLENPGGPVYAKLKQDIRLVFKQNGQLMIPAVSSSEWISGADPDVHKVITREAIYPAKFVDISGNDVNLIDPKTEKPAHLEKEDVLLIIYKDGGHEMLADPADVTMVLTKVKDHMSEYSTVKDSQHTAVAVAMELDEKQKQHFKDKALQKSIYLGKYLTLISDKNEKDDDRLYAKVQAIKLFATDSAKVEVSSVNREAKQQFMIGEYLDRIYMLPYDKVELIWINAQFIGSFRKGDNGKYYGIVTAQQLFRGFNEDKIVYQDVTEKNIEIELARYDVIDEGHKKVKWDVFLSDISVQQTREQ